MVPDRAVIKDFFEWSRAYGSTGYPSCPANVSRAMRANAETFAEPFVCDLPRDRRVPGLDCDRHLPGAIYRAAAQRVSPPILIIQVDRWRDALLDAARIAKDLERNRERLLLQHGLIDLCANWNKFAAEADGSDCTVACDGLLSTASDSGMRRLDFKPPPGQIDRGGPSTSISSSSAANCGLPFSSRNPKS
jgi:hypothetical protein